MPLAAQPLLECIAIRKRFGGVTALDGVDLVPFLTGEAEGRPHDVLFWRLKENRAVRDGDWKLIEFHEDNTVALYNLKQDPGEHHDLTADMPDLAAKLRAELDAWQAKTEAPIPQTPNPECVLPAVDAIPKGRRD